MPHGFHKIFDFSPSRIIRCFFAYPSRLGLSRFFYDYNKLTGRFHTKPAPYFLSSLSAKTPCHWNGWSRSVLRAVTAAPPGATPKYAPDYAASRAFTPAAAFPKNAYAPMRLPFRNCTGDRRFLCFFVYTIMYTMYIYSLENTPNRF